MIQVCLAGVRLSDCLAIRRAVFIEEQRVPEDLEIDELDRSGAECDHFLILDDGRPVGTFRARTESAGVMRLQRFCVLPEERKKGIGKTAIEFAAAFYREKGVHRFFIHAQCHAIGFYEKCGFHIVSDIFDDAGIPHRAMEMEL